MKYLKNFQTLAICLTVQVVCINLAIADQDLVPNQLVVSTEMSITGIDEKIAVASGNKVLYKNGYKILLNGTSGAEIARVPVKSSFPVIDPTPSNAISGNCGTSYLYLKNLGKGNYQFSTGFDLATGKAQDFTWKIQVASTWTYPNSGSYNYEWSDTGPMNASAHWTSGWKTDRSTAPYGSLHIGRVIKGFAYRNDGVICTSGYPSASVNVL